MFPRRLLPLVVIPAALLAGCSASYEGTEPTEFASIACTTWLNQGAIDGLSSSQNIQGLSGTGEDQQNQAIALAEQAVADWEENRDIIVNAKPAVQDGEEIITLFADYYNVRIDLSNEFIDEFRSYPSETGEYDELVKQGAELLFLNIEDTELDADYPFLKIKDQAVVKAMLEDATCTTFLEERGW